MWTEVDYTKAANMFLTPSAPSIISSDEFIFGEKKIPNGTMENVSFALFFQSNCVPKTNTTNLKLPQMPWLNSLWAHGLSWQHIQNIDCYWFIATGPSLGALNARPCTERFCFAEAKNATFWHTLTAVSFCPLTCNASTLYIKQLGSSQYKQDANIQWQQGGAVPLNYSWGAAQRVASLLFGVWSVRRCTLARNARF